MDMMRRYGWTRDLPDHRDLRYQAGMRADILPKSADLRAECPAVYNQLTLGSCTANAIAAALEFDQKKEGLPDSMPSRLFIYYNERAAEGTTASDGGASLRDGIKSVARQGACAESEWPYDVTRFALQPSAQCYQEAAGHRAILYHRLSQSLAQLKGCLASGYPFVFGFSVYESFESSEVATTGIMPLPGVGEALIGGHAVMAVGYSDDTQTFLVRNSWGESWGMAGYFTMPYAYLLSDDMAADCWTIQSVQ